MPQKRKIVLLRNRKLLHFLEISPYLSTDLVIVLVTQALTSSEAICRAGAALSVGIVVSLASAGLTRSTKGSITPLISVVLHVECSSSQGKGVGHVAKVHTTSVTLVGGSSSSLLALPILSLSLCHISEGSESGKLSSLVPAESTIGTCSNKIIILTLSSISVVSHLLLDATTVSSLLLVSLILLLTLSAHISHELSCCHKSRHWVSVSATTNHSLSKLLRAYFKNYNFFL